MGTGVCGQQKRQPKMQRKQKTNRKRGGITKIPPVLIQLTAIRETGGPSVCSQTHAQPQREKRRGELEDDGKQRKRAGEDSTL